MKRSAYGYRELAGLEFGYWTVLSDGKVINKNRTVPAQCKCGTTRDVLLQSLVRGKSLSCGCVAASLSSNRLLKKPIAFKLRPGESARNSLLSSYKHHAVKRGLTWEIDLELFEQLTKSNCFYCGAEPSRVQKTGYRTGVYIYNGIDRINNSLGYDPVNVVSCCKNCNFAKNNMTITEFKDWATRIAERIGKWGF
jgi:hypothetical protein